MSHNQERKKIMARINIYGELHNDTVGGFVTKSAEIYDENLQKTQSEINAELGTGGNGGRYNLDKEHKLPDGQHYTLETAVAAVAADTTVADEVKGGMTITFYDGEDWKTYRYNSTYKGSGDATKFSNTDNWVEEMENMEPITNQEINILVGSK